MAKTGENNVCGKVLKMIFNMYNRIKSCVKKNDDISVFFYM